jgi:hypothetical protein
MGPGGMPRRPSGEPATPVNTLSPALAELNELAVTASLNRHSAPVRTCLSMNRSPPEQADGKVTTLSREMTLSCSGPFVGPNGTSLLSPLAVDVIGATSP